MTIFLNDFPTELPKEIRTLVDLIDWHKTPRQGTAIALNDKLVKQDQWNVKELNNLDRITIISAAFGG